MKEKLLIGLAGIAIGSLFDDDKKSLTIVKVGNASYRPSPQDLENWRDVFSGKKSLKDFPHMKSEHVTTEEIDTSSDKHQVVLVKVGNNEYKPTASDLEYWRDIFEMAQYDKDFKIFTHHNINIEVLNFGDGKVVVDRS
jgi:hypothetical protein